MVASFSIARANITNSIYLAGVSLANGVYNTEINGNQFNVCAPAAVINHDLNIINSNVYFTRFGNDNLMRGDRSSLPSTINKPFYVNDNGTGTYGVWNFFPTPQNGWSQSTDGAYRKTMDDEIQFRGSLNAGTKTANTLITTLPVWMRPAEDFYTNVTGQTSGAISPIKVGSNGEIRVGPVAFNASDGQLYLQDKQWTVVGQSSALVGV